MSVWIMIDKNVKDARFIKGCEQSQPFVFSEAKKYNRNIYAQKMSKNSFLSL